ncbi:hypothetical protein CYMTET_45024 [Cymbomonas tetramitiformis]|uniref:Uncharacterized protein n=1 Tax=Cymbomonas tetramitiformis TaxID=36881 RepID=A0AAE0BZ15_9CHLO|nr:hypothetical protein CYMTET_45024 [Cymbomonas tetramitiformis]
METEQKADAADDSNSVWDTVADTVCGSRGGEDFAPPPALTNACILVLEWIQQQAQHQAQKHQATTPTQLTLHSLSGPEFWQTSASSRLGGKDDAPGKQDAAASEGEHPETAEKPGVGPCYSPATAPPGPAARWRNGPDKGQGRVVCGARTHSGLAAAPEGHHAGISWAYAGDMERVRNDGRKGTV